MLRNNELFSTNKMLRTVRGKKGSETGVWQVTSLNKLIEEIRFEQKT